MVGKSVRKIIILTNDDVELCQGPSVPILRTHEDSRRVHYFYLVFQYFIVSGFACSLWWEDGIIEFLVKNAAYRSLMEPLARLKQHFLLWPSRSCGTADCCTAVVQQSRPRRLLVICNWRSKTIDYYSRKWRLLKNPWGLLSISRLIVLL